MPKTPQKKASGPRQARGRFVSRSISTSEQLASVSLLADFLFERCIPHLDVTGRMTGNPALIKAGVVPLRDEINSRNLPELLRELAESVDQHGIPLVFWYEINGVKVLEFPGFSGHQTGLRSDREAPSKFPSRNGMEKLLHSAGVKPDLLPQKSGASPAQDEVEVEVEGEGEVVSAAHARTNRANPSNDAPAIDRLAPQLEPIVGAVHVPPIVEFLRRRTHTTWPGWIREMQKLVGPGSQFTADDLASVCSDDAMLEMPISGPFALRSFLGTQRTERLKQSTAPPSPPNGAPRSANGSGRAAIVLQTIREFVEEVRQPGQPIRRFIRRAKVEELGADVAKAYDAVGGAERILNATADQFGFVIRDFSHALEAAHATV